MQSEAREDDAGVRLQSMSSEVSERLIITKGSVGGRTCRDMLVDSGATACFVRRRWAEARGLPITPLPQAVPVTLADSSSQLCAVDVVANGHEDTRLVGEYQDAGAGRPTP